MGNDRIPRFQFLNNYTFANSATLGGATPAAYTGVKQTQVANPNITWEVATTYNLGFDTKFLGNAFNLEFDIYKQKRDHILANGTAVVPLYAALSLPQENVGSGESKGLEISLGYTKKIGESRL